MKKAVVIIALLLAAAGAGYAAWLRHRADGIKDAETITLYGNIDIRQVQLGFRVGGKLQEMLLDEGDPVEAGTLVARLEKTPYRDSLALAEASRDAAAAVWQKAVNGPRAGEIREARANVEELRANVDIAELTYERYRKLVATDAITREAYDQALAAKDAAQSRLEAGAQALNLLLEGTRKEDIAAAGAELRAAEAAVASARTSLSDTDLAAPSKGVVVSRVREPGAIVSAGEIVFVVSLDEPVWARLYVPEPLLGLVPPGKEVEVRTDSRPDRPHRGKIGFVSPVAEFTPKSVETPELRTDLVYRVRVVIAGPDTGLRQGMPVTVIIPNK